MRALITSAAFLMAMFPTVSLGQYRVHSWHDFEAGVLPVELMPGHHADEQTVGVVSYHGTWAAQTVQGNAATELGAYGVGFAPNSEQKHLTVFAPQTLDRSRLGGDGRALYQADFFLPAEGEPLPNVSLLAAVPGEVGKLSYEFYRFGILRGGEKVFFSFTNDNPRPEIYQTQTIAELELERPGWHRFQIILAGQDEVQCAIDGRLTSFSPIEESTHKQLNAGLMVSWGEVDQPALADNLSIQWTPHDAPLPISPWRPGQLASTPAVATSSFGAGKHWLSDPQRAWSMAKQQNRPILTMFFTPGAVPYEHLLENETTAVSATLLDEYVLLRLDANQLSGGRLAQKYNVLRIPTFIVIGPDGRESGRLTYSTSTPWHEVENFLR